MLLAWAANPSDLVTLGAAADAFEEEEQWPRAFAARWMQINKRVPGRRTDVQKKAFVWLFDTKTLSFSDQRVRSLRRHFPHAILPRDFRGKADLVESFRTATEAFHYLAGILTGHLHLLGLAPHHMPTEPYEGPRRA